MVWAARCVAARGSAEQALGMVVRSGRYEAGAGNEGDDHFATLAVFGPARENSGDGAGVFVGSAAGRRGCGRKVSCVRVCGVLPICAGAVAKGGGQWTAQRNVSGAGGALQHLPMVS